MGWGPYETSGRGQISAKARDVSLVVPRPGERVSVADPPTVDGWWQIIA